MQKIDLYSPRVIQIVLTILIWLTAALVMSACSTHKKNTTTSAPVQLETSKANASESAKTVEQKHSAVVEKQQETTVVKSVHQKKSGFFALMKPIVVAENKHILQQRQQIMHLKSQKQLNEQDLATLKALSVTYGMTMAIAPDHAFWNALLKRVNIIPMELALVQAANESAWGTSRFARDGNNYFGQWCYRKGCGIVPGQRSNGASHEVRRFNDAAGSVHAYMKNINTSRAYQYLRKIRSSLQKRNLPIKAELLANGLKHYSERGKAYVKTIRTMIRSNRTLIAQTDPIKLVQGDAR